MKVFLFIFHKVLSEFIIKSKIKIFNSQCQNFKILVQKICCHLTKYSQKDEKKVGDGSKVALFPVVGTRGAENSNRH